jgi:hypothetical protein
MSAAARTRDDLAALYLEQSRRDTWTLAATRDRGARILVPWTEPREGETWIDLADELAEAALEVFGEDARDDARSWITGDLGGPPLDMWREIRTHVVARLRARWISGELFCLDSRRACDVLRARPPAGIASADTDVEILRQLCLAHREIQRDAAAFLLVAPTVPQGVRLDGHDGALAALRKSFPF